MVKCVFSVLGISSGAKSCQTDHQSSFWAN